MYNRFIVALVGGLAVLGASLFVATSSTQRVHTMGGLAFVTQLLLYLILGSKDEHDSAVAASCVVWILAGYTLLVFYRVHRFAFVLCVPYYCVVTYTLYTQLQRARERWDLYTELDNIVPKTSRIASFRDIRYVVYVNLAHRTDRKAETEEELRRMGWNPIRIDAVRYTPGAYGCTKSHIKAIEYAKQRQWSHVLICEDDVHFQRSPAEIRVQLDTFFQHHPKKNDWDVVMLGGESFHMQSMGSGIVRVQSASLSHCYLIRAEYYDVLLSNLHRSLGRYPMDLFWGALQKRDMWLMPIPLIATQRTSYSDLQHRVTEHVDRVSDQVTG